jgi:hypothetical protein
LRHVRAIIFIGGNEPRIMAAPLKIVTVSKTAVIGSATTVCGLRGAKFICLRDVGSPVKEELIIRLHVGGTRKLARRAHRSSVFGPYGVGECGVFSKFGQEGLDGFFDGCTLRLDGGDALRLGFRSGRCAPVFGLLIGRIKGLASSYCHFPVFCLLNVP